jgi:hypothetical protein
LPLGGTPQPRPITEADCDALMSKRPHHVAAGRVGDRRWWAARYDGFDQIVVTVWAGEGFVFKQTNVWFPGATPESIDRWVATQPPPIPRARPESAHLDRRPDDPDIAA